MLPVGVWTRISAKTICKQFAQRRPTWELNTGYTPKVAGTTEPTTFGPPAISATRRVELIVRVCECRLREVLNVLQDHVGVPTCVDHDDYEIASLNSKVTSTRRWKTWPSKARPKRPCPQACRRSSERTGSRWAKSWRDQTSEATNGVACKLHGTHKPNHHHVR